MPPNRRNTTLADRVIAHLQQLLLEAVLTGKPLPGADQPIRLPDLTFNLHQQVLIVLADNLAGTLSIESSPKPIHILSRDSFVERARSHGPLTALHFQPTQVEDNDIGLTVEVLLAQRDAKQPVVKLSSAHARFQKNEDHWKAVGGPVLMAD
jgi:hypothetical protein